MRIGDYIYDYLNHLPDSINDQVKVFIFPLTPGNILEKLQQSLKSYEQEIAWNKGTGITTIALLHCVDCNIMNYARAMARDFIKKDHVYISCEETTTKVIRKIQKCFKKSKIKPEIRLKKIKFDHSDLLSNSLFSLPFDTVEMIKEMLPPQLQGELINTMKTYKHRAIIEHAGKLVLFTTSLKMKFKTIVYDVNTYLKFNEFVISNSKGRIDPLGISDANPGEIFAALGNTGDNRDKMIVQSFRGDRFSTIDTQGYRIEPNFSKLLIHPQIIKISGNLVVGILSKYSLKIFDIQKGKIMYNQSIRGYQYRQAVHIKGTSKISLYGMSTHNDHIQIYDYENDVLEEIMFAPPPNKFYCRMWSNVDHKFNLQVGDEKTITYTWDDDTRINDYTSVFGDKKHAIDLPDGSKIEYQTLDDNKTKVYLTTSPGKSKLLLKNLAFATNKSEHLQIAYFENEKKLVISDGTNLYFFK
jgi:hypothetical protein